MHGLFVNDFRDFTVTGDTVQLEFSFQSVTEEGQPIENVGNRHPYYLFMPLEVFEKLAIASSKMYAVQLASNRESITQEKLGRALAIPDQRY